jgi:hypothetical protein
MKNDGSAGVVWLVLIAAIAWGLQKGWVYQTGQQWFDSCWASVNSQTHTPTSPDEAVAWGKCEPEARKALFEGGYIFAGNPQNAATPQLKAVAAACPSNYTDIPLGGLHMLAIQMLQDTGGPTWYDRFLPPDRMILRTFNKRWPQCSATRASNGFPLIVEKNGDWDFASHCVPCEAEKK